MKLLHLTNTNSKGQLVIPKSIRSSLGITSNVILSIGIAGKSIYIKPVDNVITKEDSESSYFLLLKKTKGAWQNANDNKKHVLELKASQKRKTAW